MGYKYLLLMVVYILSANDGFNLESTDFLRIIQSIGVKHY